MIDLYDSRGQDDNGEELCALPEAQDASDVIALHLAHEADPVKAIAEFHLATFKASQLSR